MNLSLYLRRSLLLFGCSCLALLMASSSGCSKAPTIRKDYAVLKGTVTLKGVALKDGMVRGYLESDQRRNSSARIQPDGSYVMECPIGKVLICVQNDDLLMGGDKAAYVKLPEKYIKAETSGFTADIVAGENSFDIDMK